MKKQKINIFKLYKKAKELPESKVSCINFDITKKRRKKMIPIKEEEHNQRIGKAIREFRLNYKNPDKPKTVGMTQTVLANRIFVTFQQVQKYEKGTNGTSSYRLLQISEALGVRVSDIFIKAYHDIPEILTYFEDKKHKYTEVSIEEIKQYPNLNLSPKYWIEKKENEKKED
jgi:transcriptional regulator with XRE-family HTH domain